jgi:diguanylate cyclase (GGDEF)-like protein
MRERHIKLRESYFKKPFSRLMGEGGLSLFIYNKEKKKIPMEAALFSIQSDKGALAVNILRDVSDEVEEKKKIEKKAFHDELTGLPNRYYLYEMAEQMIGQAKRNKQILTVLVIDLDKFKPVNDTLGHAVGDHVLKELGQRLGQLKRKNEFIARIGGDEFVYLGFANKGDDHQVLPKRIIDACEVPFIYKDNLIQISASIGMILEGC